MQCECVCVPCDLCLAPEVQLKSLGRRVNWMFTHAETDAHKHTHTAGFLGSFPPSSQQAKKEKACLLSGGAGPPAHGMKWRMKLGLVKT